VIVRVLLLLLGSTAGSVPLAGGGRGRGWRGVQGVQPRHVKGHEPSFRLSCLRVSSSMANVHVIPCWQSWVSPTATPPHIRATSDFADFKCDPRQTLTQTPKCPPLTCPRLTNGSWPPVLPLSHPMAKNESPSRANGQAKITIPAVDPMHHHPVPTAHASVHASTDSHPLTHSTTCPSIHPSIHPSICPSIQPSTHPCMHPTNPPTPQHINTSTHQHIHPPDADLNRRSKSPTQSPTPSLHRLRGSASHAPHWFFSAHLRA